MIEMIAELIKRDLAYQAEDKSVYFRINKFPEYGKLAHLNLEELRPTGRVRSDEYEKENIGDFALWKAWDEEDGDVGWDSPWGRGRPGWHIECSAMSTVLLGDQLDIHCGGVDNIFPHHEAEIAQSEGVTGKKFVRYWMHCAHLLVDNQKMSKSLGNFYTLRDVIAKGYTGREARYALLRVHYRAPLNFTFEGMEESRQALTRIDEWLERLRETSESASPESPGALVPDDNFQQTLDDDLNISGALGVLFESIRETNRAMDANEFGPGAPVYLFTKLNDIKPQMIAEATRNARAAAEQFAKDSGAKIGGIRRANQGLFEILPRDRAPQLTEETQIEKTVRVVSTVDYLLVD